MGALKKLFGKDLPLDKLPAEIKPLLEQMRQERSTFESLLLQAQGTIKRAEQLGQVVAPIQQQLAQVEQRLTALDSASAQLSTFKQDAAGLEAGQTSTRARLDETRSLAEGAHTELQNMQGMLAEVLKAKEQLPGLLEIVKPLGLLLSQAAALDERMREVSGRFDQLRNEHEKIASGGAAGLARLADLEQRLQSAASGFEAFQARADKLEHTVDDLQRLLKEAPDVKRELSTLNVLAEFVTQKVSALENQRDLAERATQRTERLTELAGQVDRQLQEQHENTKFLSQLQGNVDEIKKLHEAALQRADEIDSKHRAIDAESKRLGEEFTAQHESLQRSASEFKFERDALDALSQRVTELRETLGSVEKRLPVVDEARSGLEAVAADAERLKQTMAGLSRQVQGLESAATMAQAVDGQVQQLRTTVEELARRLEAVASPQLYQDIEERTRQFEEVRARVAQLETRLAEWNAVEQRAEQSLQLATERRAAVDAVRADLQRLFEVADTTASRVRDVAGLQHEIDERRESLESVLGRFRDLDHEGEALEQRKKDFQEAEERLSRLDALLIDLQSTLKTVLDQKGFLERVLETAGSLALQTMQAEAAIKNMREASEGAKRGKR